MKRVVLFVLMVLVGGVVWASTIPTNMPEYKAVVRSRADKVRSISDEAKFYLVTCEPGEEVYERFGHSGIRVYDPVTGIDEVFHWGLFSFDTPNFIGRFISGNTDYEMGVYSTKFFVLQYIERGSAIYLQELDFTPEQKHTFWAKLWENYRPENRKYRYNFIYDNCATRPYQSILCAFNYKVHLDLHQQDITYRDIINSYMPIGSLYNTGINIIIGSSADKYISAKESVSFPIYTMNVLNCTKYITDNGLKPIVKSQETLHKAPRKVFSTSLTTYYASIIIPLLLAFLCILYAYKKQRYVPYFTQIILLISAIVGAIISYLWFCSHHPIVDNNMNILWCNPFNVILAIILFLKKKSLRTMKLVFAIVNIVLCAAFIITLIANIQHTTPQILSIWFLIITINGTIAKTYKAQIKHRHHK